LSEENVHGIIPVVRLGLLAGKTHALLIFTSERVIVARTKHSGGSFTALGGILGGVVGAAVGVAAETLSDVLRADKNNYAIPNSEIRQVEPHKKGLGLGVDLHIETDKKKHCPR